MTFCNRNACSKESRWSAKPAFWPRPWQREAPVAWVQVSPPSVLLMISPWSKLLMMDRVAKSVP